MIYGQIGHPVQETIIVSIHVNAAGNSKRWYNATGWCCYTYYGHKIKTDFADCGIELERNNHLADFTNVINTVQKSRAVNSHP